MNIFLLQRIFILKKYSHKLGLSFRYSHRASLWFNHPLTSAQASRLCGDFEAHAVKPVGECSLDTRVALLTQESNPIALLFIKRKKWRNIKIMRKYAMCVAWRYTQSYLKHPLCKMKHQSASKCGERAWQIQCSCEAVYTVCYQCSI